MLSEVENIREHWRRFREVTLASLALLSDDDLAWRPRPDLFSCGQHLVHVLQSEDFYTHGLFRQDWDLERLRFPTALPACAELRASFERVRAMTNEHFAALTEAQLGEITHVPNSGLDLPLRWWLWFVLEHEVHHKAQLAMCLRDLGKVPPFFAFVLPNRPDIQAREQLGGI